MVHQDMIVQWMDLHNEHVDESKISKMFGQYIANANTTSDDGSMNVKFKHDVVKITDWKGWSRVMSITRVPNIVEWVKLTTEHGTTITATPDTVIMIYNSGNIRRGFHGESKYAFENTLFKNINIGDVVRVRHTQGTDGYDIDFDKIFSIEHMMTEPAIGYHIITKAGFFNCNDYYISGK